LDVTFDMKLPAFRQMLPENQRESISRYSQEDLECRITTYVFLHLKSFYTAHFYFVDDDLYDMSVSYDTGRLWELGGFEAIQKRLVKKLGPPHLLSDPESPNSSAIVRIWEFPEHDRKITLRWRDDVSIYVERPSREEIAKARQKAFRLKEKRKAESKDAGF
jgi:hypothetical protein